MAANNITHISYRSMKEGKLKIAWNFILYFFFTAAVMHVINALSGDDRFREVAKHGLRMSLKCLEYLKPYWFGAERCIFVIRDLLRVRNINLDGFNPNGTEHVDQNNTVDPFETKLEGNIVTCINTTVGGLPKTQANSQHRVLFAPSASESPTTSPHVAATATDQYSQAIMQQMAAAAAAVVASQNTSNGTASNHSSNAQQSNQALPITNSSTSKQESSPQISYEQSPSPASSSSSNSTSFMPFGDFMNTDNAFFPPNTDAFLADVNSVLFDEDDPMGNNNPFWAVPSTFDWNDWTDYMNGMHGLRANTATTTTPASAASNVAAGLLSGVRGNVSLGSDMNNPQRIPHGL